MKTIKLNLSGLLLMTAIFILASCGRQEAKDHTNDEDNTPDAPVEVMHLTTEFYVRGNCEMCKDRIETALMELEGVELADWEVETKMVTVIYDSNLLDEMKLHQTTASVGHGTHLVNEDEPAYSELPNCCKKPEDPDYIPMN